jgi:hypothetical protein
MRCAGAWLLSASLLAGCGSGGSATVLGSDSDRTQPSLASVVDPAGRLWIVSGYTDQSMPAISQMGLSIRSPDGVWQSYPPLSSDGSFAPSGDGWLATAQGGLRAYYVSLLDATPNASTNDESGDGLALATIEVTDAGPTVTAPQRIDLGDWPSWDEPTISATRPPGAAADTVLAAGTPIGPDYQDVVSVLVSHDGGQSFHDAATLLAPGSPGRVYGRRDDTLVRPVLQQDPRPGQECHAYVAFGVYYATALRSTPGLAPPACLLRSGGCRSLAESETRDCGDTWSPPVFIAVDTGPPGGLDFRGFGYAIANDGTRLVLFTDENAPDAPILLKRAAPDSAFTVTASIAGTATWDDGPIEIVVAGPSDAGVPVSRWRPTLSASSGVAAIWVEEALDTHASSLRFSTSPSWPPAGWAPARLVDPGAVGTVCDAQLPDDDYMALTPGAPFASPASHFVVAWTGFAPCGSQDPHHIFVATVP